MAPSVSDPSRFLGGFLEDAGTPSSYGKGDFLQPKGGSRPAHFVGGLDTDGDAAVDGNSDMLI